MASWTGPSFLSIAGSIAWSDCSLSLLLLTGIQVVLRFWLLQVKLLGTFVYNSLCEHILSFLLGNTPSGMAGSHGGRCMLHFIKSCQTACLEEDLGAVGFCSQGLE